MSRWIRRMVVAAAIGMFATGAASAQQPQPAAPAPAPAPAPAFVQAPGAPAFVAGGCGSVASDCCCKSRGKHDKHNRRCDGGRWGGLTIGAGCANTVNCGNWATHRTFAFGSCNQFFNSGNKCGHGGGLLGKCGGGLLFGRAECATPPLGTGIAPCGPCVYTSYLNR